MVSDQDRPISLAEFNSTNVPLSSTDTFNSLIDMIFSDLPQATMTLLAFEV